MACHGAVVCACLEALLQGREAMAMRVGVLLAMSGVGSAIPTPIGRQLQSATPDKCTDPESFQGDRLCLCLSVCLSACLPACLPA